MYPASLPRKKFNLNKEIIYPLGTFVVTAIQSSKVQKLTRIPATGLTVARTTRHQKYSNAVFLTQLTTRFDKCQQLALLICIVGILILVSPEVDILAFRLKY